MILDTRNINTLWASALIEELRRLDIRQVFISPGSRSAPLTVAAARHPDLETLVHFDERGAAFAALGHARATGKPAALICTSGTAVANYLPAVVEASMDGVPMLLLTADRPPELLGCGANQTITQPGIFSPYVRHELDLPCPEMPPDLRTLLSSIDRTAYAAMSLPRGPVHVNCPFREPLHPLKLNQDFTSCLEPVREWLDGTSPLSRHVDAPRVADAAAVHDLTEVIATAGSGIIVAGKLDADSDRDAVIELSEQIGWPVLPDIQSGLRLGLPHPHLVTNYDLMLNADTLQTSLACDACLHIGGRVTSKRLLQWLAAIRPRSYVVINDTALPFDPNHQVTARINSSISLLYRDLKKHLGTGASAGNLERWQQGSERTAETVSRLIEAGTLNEPAVANLLSQLIPSRHVLWLASSMPIRLMDSYAAESGASVPLGANRGASGIDGTIASAAGFSIGHQRPVTLLIGDLAFLHDLNSLALVKQSPYPMTIVLLNNDGGGIFSFLPIAEHEDIFDRFFKTPHGMTFESIASQFNLDYQNVHTLDQFQIAYTRQRESSHSSVIEVMLDRKATVDCVRLLARAVADIHID